MFLIKLDVVVTAIERNASLNLALFNPVLQPFKAMFYSLKDEILAIVNLVVG